MLMRTFLCACVGLLVVTGVSFAEIDVIYHDGPQARPVVVPANPVVVVPEAPWVAPEHIRIEPKFGWMLGESTYHIDGFDSGQSWASELRFPLDTLVAGGDVALTLGPLVIGGRASVSLTDPIGSLEDRDWVPAGYLRGYTESEVELDATLIDGYIKIPFRMGPQFWMGEAATVYGTAEYTYQNFEYEAYGAEGWYSFNPAGIRVPVYEPTSVNVIDYRIQYNMGCLGAGVINRFGRVLDFECRVLAGMVWVDDEDDHVLRSKSSEGDAVGFVTKVHGSGTWNLMLLEGGGRWFLKGAMDFLILGATGEQTQSYYDGSAFPAEVDYDNSSAQFVLSGALGCAF